MVIRSKMGVILRVPDGFNEKKWLFGEDQSRYIVVVKSKSKIEKLAEKNNVYIENIGIVRGENLEVEKLFEISIKKLIDINYKFFKNIFS